MSANLQGTAVQEILGPSWEYMKDECDRLRSERDELLKMLDQLATGMEQIAKAIPEAVAYMPGIKWMPEQARALLAKHGR